MLVIVAFYLFIVFRNFALKSCYHGNFVISYDCEISWNFAPICHPWYLRYHFTQWQSHSPEKLTCGLWLLSIVMTIKLPEDRNYQFLWVWLLSISYTWIHLWLFKFIYFNLLCSFLRCIYWMTYAQGLFVKRKHQPKQRKKDKTGSPHNKLRCECNNLVTDVVTSVHITLLCPDF